MTNSASGGRGKALSRGRLAFSPGAGADPNNEFVITHSHYNNFDTKKSHTIPQLLTINTRERVRITQYSFTLVPGIVYCG